MKLSERALDSMDFKEIPAGTSVITTFNSLSIYTLIGLILEDDSNKAIINGQIGNFNYAIGNRVNNLSQFLVQDDLHDDEIAWMKAKNIQSPFLVIHHKLNEPSLLNKGHWKVEKDLFLTYDSFPGLREKILELDRARIPSIISSLIIHFSDFNPSVAFYKLDHHIFGKTLCGNTIIDNQFKFSAKISIESPVTPTDLTSKLPDVHRSLKNINPKVSTLFQSSIETPDRFKEFLFLFQAIEIHTHITFKGIDFKSQHSTIQNIPNRLNSSGLKLFVKQQSDCKALTDRFIWCAIVKWHHINDKDVQIFRNLKSVRDELSHGNEVPESSLDIDNARFLLIKLLRECP